MRPGRRKVFQREGAREFNVKVKSKKAKGEKQ
jgi:hypothetical protein